MYVWNTRHSTDSQFAWTLTCFALFRNEGDSIANFVEKLQPYLALFYLCKNRRRGKRSEWIFQVQDPTCITFDGEGTVRQAGNMPLLSRLFLRVPFLRMDLKVAWAELYEIWGNIEASHWPYTSLLLHIRSVAPFGNQSPSKQKLKTNFAPFCPLVIFFWGGMGEMSVSFFVPCLVPNHWYTFYGTPIGRSSEAKQKWLPGGLNQTISFMTIFVMGPTLNNSFVSVSEKLKYLLQTGKLFTSLVMCAIGDVAIDD